MPKPASIFSGASPAQVAADLAPLVQFQAEGLSPEELTILLTTGLLPHLMHYDHPGFQSMFNAYPSAEAKLGAQIMLDYNQGVTNWQVSPGGATLEELCSQALCRLFGLDFDADATFMYSGTYANQQALYMALHRYAERQGGDLARQGIAGLTNPERLAVLVSKDAHFSLRHAVRMLGLGERCLVPLAVDVNRRIDVDALRQTVSEVQKTRNIVCMVATAGTTTTGAVDPIAAMARLCSKIGAWLHVDGAYGYAYKLVPEWTDLYSGDEQADSITWDPHKQLGAPIPNSILFARRRTDFERMALFSSYFNRAEDVEPNPGLKSPPSTRPMSVLPLVTLLRGKGLNRIIKDLRAPLKAILALADDLQKRSGVELCHRPDTGIICFRLKPQKVSTDKLDAFQRHIYEQVMASGEQTISLTKLDGKTVLRLVVVSPESDVEALRQTIDRLFDIALKE